MQYVVYAALAATVAFMTLWVGAQATELRKGQGVFEITTKDPVARTVLRAVQAAFVIGYGAFFLLGVGALIHQI